MSFFDDVMGRLFGKKEEEKVPLVHEVLERSEREKNEYQAWVDAGDYKDLVQAVSSGYLKKKMGILAELDVHLLETPYSNGFAISFNDKLGTVAFRNLFDYLKEQTLGMSYKLSQADRRMSGKTDYAETIEKWYLKPNAQEEEDQVLNQLYGNVLIEHVTIDSRPSYIRLMVNVYQGRQYSEPLKFDHYLERLLHVE